MIHLQLSSAKQLWSRLCNKPRHVTRALSVSPGVAPPAMAEPTSAEGHLALVTAHLEYMGYEIGPADPHGWSPALHPDRYNFHLRTFDRGLRLHCTVELGASPGNNRAAWLDFLNGANERGHITRLSLFEAPAGVWRIMMQALVSGAYSRAVFAMAMDMWHDDLDVVRRRPAFPAESNADQVDDVTVH